MGFPGRRRYIIWSRFFGDTNRFDTVLQIDAMPETKFENEDDYDTRHGAAS
jgi:hypothetical protein